MIWWEIFPIALQTCLPCLKYQEAANSQNDGVNSLFVVRRFLDLFPRWFGERFSLSLCRHNVYPASSIRNREPPKRWQKLTLHRPRILGSVSEVIWWANFPFALQAQLLPCLKYQKTTNRQNDGANSLSIRGFLDLFPRWFGERFFHSLCRHNVYPASSIRKPRIAKMNG